MLPPSQAPPSAIDDKRRLHAKWRVLPDVVVDSVNLAVSGMRLGQKSKLSANYLFRLLHVASSYATKRILRRSAANSSSLNWRHASWLAWSAMD